MSKDTDAKKVLDRFAPQVRWVTDSVMDSFELEPHFKDDVRQQAHIRLMSYADLLDVTMDGHGRLASWTVRANGDEGQIKAMLAYQLRIDLAKDAGRMIHRNGDHAMHDSLDQMIEDWNAEPQSGPGETFNVVAPPEEPSVDYDEVLERLTDPGSKYLKRFVREYPLLAMQVIGELPLDEIRKRVGMSPRQVTYRLELEKADLAPVWEYEGSLFGDWLRTLTRDKLTKIRREGLWDYLMVEVSEKRTDNGIVYLLKTEGDEELEDLVEAKTHLFAVGR